MSTSPLPPDEILQPIPKVCERLTGRRAAPCTVWRWIRKGVRGVKLKATLLGGQWLCSEDDFRRFLAEQTQAALSVTAPSDDATDKELREHGLL